MCQTRGKPLNPEIQDMRNNGWDENGSDTMANPAIQKIPGGAAHMCQRPSKSIYPEIQNLRNHCWYGRIDQKPRQTQKSIIFQEGRPICAKSPSKHRNPEIQNLRNHGWYGRMDQKPWRIQKSRRLQEGRPICAKNQANPEILKSRTSGTMAVWQLEPETLANPEIQKISRGPAHMC